MNASDPPRKLGKGPIDIPALVFALVGILVFVMLWAMCGVLGAVVGGWVRSAPTACSVSDIRHCRSPTIPTTLHAGRGRQSATAVGRQSGTITDRA
jgi:hypothetical protein